MSDNLKKKIVKELNKPARKNFPRLKMCVRGLHETWNADLMDMSSFADFNNNHRYVLLIIDSLSKFIYCEAIKNKNANSMFDAFVKIFKRSNIYPKNLQTDEGKEFFNKKMNHLFKQHNINHYHTFSIIKSSFAERAIKTIKQKIFIHFALTGKYNYIDKLQDIVKEYNNQIHHTTKYAPCKVTAKVAKKLLKTVFYDPNVFHKKVKFNVNDFVRISEYKKLFEKSYTPSWSSEIFKIKKVKYTEPITYIIQDLHDNEISGNFYQEELQKTNFPNDYLVEKILKKKGNRVFVKWWGFSPSHNSWENLDDILD